MQNEIQLINGLNNSEWLSRIYDIISASPPANELDCFNQCLNIQKANCDFFVYVDATCFLGNYDTFKMPTSNSNFVGLKNVTVKIINGKCYEKNIFLVCPIWLPLFQFFYCNS